MIGNSSGCVDAVRHKALPDHRQLALCELGLGLEEAGSWRAELAFRCPDVGGRLSAYCMTLSISSLNHLCTCRVNEERKRRSVLSLIPPIILDQACRITRMIELALKLCRESSPRRSWRDLNEVFFGSKIALLGESQGSRDALASALLYISRLREVSTSTRSG